MGSTYLSIHYHVVFATKHRRRLMTKPWRFNLHEYLGGTVRGLGGVPEAIGGVEDHVHLLVGLRATHTLSSFMRELKKASSKWATEKHEPAFGWQDGYAAFSVSWRHADQVMEYIRNQEAHHRNVGYLDELKQLLVKNGVEYDPQYLS